MRISEELWAEAKEAAVPLLAQLEGEILGKRSGGFQCNCGCISHGESEAVSVSPAGQEEKYANQMTDWFLWTVKMRHVEPSDEKKYHYSCGISRFMDVKIIEKMFSDAFGDLPSRIETDSY